MNQRVNFLLLAAAMLVPGGTSWPAAAYGDLSGSGARLPGQPLVPAVPALELRAIEPPPPEPAGRGQRFAHAIIIRTSPEQGGVAPETIGKVDVWYDAGIRDDFVALAVINAAGDRVDKRDAAIDSSDQAHVSASVEALTPGEYTVRYRALSADGHLVSGAWVFEVGPKQ